MSLPEKSVRYTSNGGTNDPPSPKPSPQQDHNNNTDATSIEKDAFLYFSNEERRMEYLMGREVMPELDASVAAENPQDQDATERKTRISFELHPDLIMEDTLPDVLGGEDGNHGSTSTSSRSNVTGTGVTQISNSNAAILRRQLLMMDLQDSADAAGGTSSDMARQNGEE